MGERTNRGCSIGGKRNDPGRDGYFPVFCTRGYGGHNKGRRGTRIPPTVGQVRGTRNLFFISHKTNFSCQTWGGLRRTTTSYVCSGKGRCSHVYTQRGLKRGYRRCRPYNKTTIHGRHQNAVTCFIGRVDEDRVGTGLGGGVCHCRRNSF